MVHRIFKITGWCRLGNTELLDNHYSSCEDVLKYLHFPSSKKSVQFVKSVNQSLKKPFVLIGTKRRGAEFVESNAEFFDQSKTFSYTRDKRGCPAQSSS